MGDCCREADKLRLPLLFKSKLLELRASLCELFMPAKLSLRYVRETFFKLVHFLLGLLSLFEKSLSLADLLSPLRKCLLRFREYFLSLVEKAFFH